MTGIVEFHNVGVRYGTGIEVLADLNVTLRAGGCYLLTGPSGAGKSAIVRLMTLAEAPSRGILRLFGTDAAAIGRSARAAMRRRIGLVAPDMPLLGDCSISANIALPLRVAGLAAPSIADAVAEMLDWIGLGDRADAHPAALSEGERRRVALARAMIAKPDLLIADEPAAGLDAASAARVIAMIEAAHDLGTAVFVATHDAAVARLLSRASRLPLARGRIADPTGMLRHPPGIAA